ncbi:MAG: sulfatase-like hydrolase/transferase, partial [Bacteroidales bacterium]
MKNLLVFAFVMCSIILVTGCTEEEDPVSPNIILLISDDQGWTDYSFLGHEHIQTPRIDQLAAEGLTFTQGYTTAPLCRPALASMATGLYPHQHGVLGNDPVYHAGADPDHGEGWRERRAVLNSTVVKRFEGLPTLADLLEKAGYVSLQTGKWWEGHYSSGGFSQGMTHGDPSRRGRHGDEGLRIGRESLEVIYDFTAGAPLEAPPPPPPPVFSLPEEADGPLLYVPRPPPPGKESPTSALLMLPPPPPLANQPPSPTSSPKKADTSMPRPPSPALYLGLPSDSSVSRPRVPAPPPPPPPWLFPGAPEAAPPRFP